jgi:hypothetical protein
MAAAERNNSICPCPMAPELPKPDVRPQLRELLAWYDDVLERVADGALVAPGVAERLREEQDFTARFLEFLDAGEQSGAGEFW